ncbi:MAG: hypothetical protein AAGA78_12015 [Pseudomonadota bacterium]
MTALSAYVVLESTGLWQQAEGAEARDVVVSFGKSSLVLSTTDDTPLAHWALTGIAREGSTDEGAVFAVEGSPERLTIADAHMIDAIQTVSHHARTVKARAAPRAFLIFGALLVAALVAAVVYVPPALRSLAVDMVAPE